MSDNNNTNKKRQNIADNNGFKAVEAISIKLGDPQNETLPKELPVLVLRNAVLFPGTVLPVAIGRRRSCALINALAKDHGTLVAVPQMDSDDDDPALDKVFNVGVVAHVVKVMTMPDNSQTVILHGSECVEIGEQVSDDPYFVAKIKRYRTLKPTKAEQEKLPAIISVIKDLAIDVFRMMDNAPSEVSVAIKNIDDPNFLVNFIASNIDASVDQKELIIVTKSVFKKAEALVKILEEQSRFLKIKCDIQNKARKGIDKQQREYVLMQQMQAIRDELGDNPQENTIAEYKKRARSKKWGPKIKQAFEKELSKFERLNSNSAEYSIVQSYLETLLDLPWGVYSKDDIDLDKAEKQLNADHFGMDKVKERILEHLAVLKLKGDLKSPIICLYGPPGVGKTSLGKSIATALGRKYVRMSLGGVHDEAEIRGHRRTYIGAMPGRVMENIKNAGTSNPVFILDEIDKVTTDFHGDPASALLEVLDPEQNNAFHDNYLDLDYDLSKVMFIATANNIANIQGPLLDRMELIPIDGYLLEEKVQIAQRHLLPKEKENHGLAPDDFSIPDDVLSYVIDKYTRESGVRELSKVIAHICRKVALLKARGKEIPASLSTADVREFLGVEKVYHDMWTDDLKAGVVTGLAWTAVGGEILFVECATSRGRGGISLTGNLGNVMKESASLALEYVRSNAALFGLEKLDFDAINLHIHVPEGAVPKDGPSAGITMVTAIVSALTGRRVNKRFAMTGEITLRGKVIPVGGITEKILAAKRVGITDVILCNDNKKDIDEIKKEYTEGLTFHYVSYIREVINIALEPTPTDAPYSAIKSDVKVGF